MLTPIEIGAASVVTRIPSTRRRPPSGVPLPVGPGFGCINAAAPTGTTSEIVSTPGRTRHPRSRHGRLRRAPGSGPCGRGGCLAGLAALSQCGRKWCIKGPIRSRTLQDLVFGRASLKRRCVKYVFQTYRCRKSNTVFGVEDRYEVFYKYGWDLSSLLSLSDRRPAYPDVYGLPALWPGISGSSILGALNEAKVKAAGPVCYCTGGQGTSKRILDHLSVAVWCMQMRPGQTSKVSPHMCGS